VKSLIRWAPTGVAITLALASPAAADPVAEPPAGRQAKVCSTCHKAVEPGTIRGHFDEYSVKATSLQVRVDGDAEVLSYDPATLQIQNAPEPGDVEKALKSIRKGAEVRVTYAAVGGVRKVSVLTVKPKLKLAAEKQVTTADLEKLVAAGPAKGRYVLFDARPFPKYAEGFIPTAESLPFPAFEKEKGKLPADKSTLVIFYCAGVTCAMSPAARDAAEALGYGNAKVYHEGVPVWAKLHPLALSAKLLKEAWLEKEQPLILLDARKKATGGVIPGAVAFPDTSRRSLDTLFKFRKLRPPIVVYDADGKGPAAKVAAAIVKEGYAVMVLGGGVAAWKAAGYALAAGAPARAITYVPKPRPGALPAAAFRDLVAAIPADTLVLDVRSADEVTAGAFPGAVHIPADQIATRLAELPKDKRIVTHCTTGTRAEMVYNVLKGAGFTDVAFLATTVEFDGGKAEIGE
jgi:rhodanese-related sulfurtransferase